MKNILILGAGRVSNNLVDYLVSYAAEGGWFLLVADKDVTLAEKVTQNRPHTIAIELDVFNKKILEDYLKGCEVVVSLLPAKFHFFVGELCVKHQCSLFTASYEASNFHCLDTLAKENGILILNEMGLDPGLDHLSAMRIINRLKREGHQLHTFESFTGGLPAPESDDNPWHYKFTWSPRNVVLGGQDKAVRFKQEGTLKYIPYHKVFRRYERIHIDEYGDFDAYANRDSLGYVKAYGLEEAQTVFRGTLRGRGFCRAWDALVQLGLTDDSFEMEFEEKATHRDYVNAFLFYRPHDTVELKFMHYLGLDYDSEVIDKVRWLGLFENIPLGIRKGTPAQILQQILMKKWKFGPLDKDMVVMFHKFFYKENGTNALRELHSYLVTKGEGGERTAMAKTVGLPLAVTVRLFLEGRIKARGVQLPLTEEFYEPVLNELKEYDIWFRELCVGVDQIQSRFITGS